MVWHRSDCVRSDEGIWLCPDEQDGGRTGTTLDRTNQQNALSGWVPRGPREPY